MKKKNLLYIEISLILVVVLTIATLRVSFSYITNINSDNKIREITAGNLNISLNVKNIDGISLLPTNINELPINEHSKTNGNYATVKITNNGNLKSIYDIFINYDIKKDDNLDNYLNLKYLLLGIYDKEEEKWLKFEDNYYYDFENKDNHKVLTRRIKERSDYSITHEYDFYIWLKKDAPKSEIGKLVSLKIDLESRVDN